jgi:DNA polymerase III delta prime subunit
MNLTYHAYFFTGDGAKALDFLDKNLDIKKQGNPDYIFQKIDALSIDEARNIKLVHSKKPFGEKRIFIIQTESISVESQNALLKVFEEPEPNNHFFIIIENPQLLPTLKSRVQIINFEKENTSVEKFLKLGKKERLDFVKELSKTEGYTLADGIGRTQKDRKTLEAVVKVKKYINDRGSSTKQLLEYLAITV